MVSLYSLFSQGLAQIYVFSTRTNQIRVLIKTFKSSAFLPINLRNSMKLLAFLRFLRFFTCVSWGISPAQILLIVQTTAIRHSISYFSSFSMFIQSRISKSIVICLSTLFSDLPYCFLFKSVTLFFLFSCCSLLSASPLCSIPIQPVLFLLVFILLDPSI